MSKSREVRREVQFFVVVLLESLESRRSVSGPDREESEV